MPNNKDIKQHLAEGALAIVNGSRQAEYGGPERSFANITAFWNAYLYATGREMILSDRDISPMMRLMKEARLCTSPCHLDSLMDLIGYTLTGAEVNGVTVPDDV